MQSFEHIGIPERFSNKTFSDFSVTDKNRKAFDYVSVFCESFCNDKSFRNSYRSLYIFGPTCRGKTHLSAAALHSIHNIFDTNRNNYLEKLDVLRDQRRELLSQFQSGKIPQEHYDKIESDINNFIENSNCPDVDFLFLNTRVFCDQLRESWRNKQGKRLTENASKVNLLVIDDLGNEPLNSLHKGYVQEIIQIIFNRYDSNKPTIINSQYNLGEIGNRYEISKLFSNNLIESFISRISDNITGVYLGGDPFKSNNILSGNDL